MSDQNKNPEVEEAQVVEEQSAPATETKKKYPYEVKPDGKAAATPPPPQGKAAAQPQNAAGPGPLTPEQAKQNAVEQDRKTMRVLQIVQHEQGQKIEIHPIQNVTFRSDIIGILQQALNNIQNEDQMRNSAALMRETVSIIRSDVSKIAAPTEQSEQPEQGNQAG